MQEEIGKRSPPQPMGEADAGSQRDVWERPTLHDVFKHLCGLLPVEDVDWGVFVAVVAV